MSARPLGKSDPHRVSEKDFSTVVAEAFKTFRWTAMHVFALQTTHGYRTPTTAPGYPDWTAIRQGYVIGLELKGYTARGDAGRLADQQVHWLEEFAQIPTGRAWVLKPTDPWEDFIELLRHPETAPRRYGYQVPESQAR